ncbi:carbamoyltransferase HypF [Alteromonas sp. ZYF713]|nr:carbamoyltransferase HypF [Alteromonas sp. ZYF713]
MPHSKGMRLRVNGIVQGVGFRPFIWRLATELKLTGRVYNDAGGVIIELNCNEAQAGEFAEVISQQLPPLARIDAMHHEPLDLPLFSSFEIDVSQSGIVTTGCAPDAATCPDCLTELNQPGDRRYQYPFINCTNCGPRLSIIRQIPYDRASTTMAKFTLCAACQQEYDNPADRRFHAQPNACPDCGPYCWLEAPDGELVASESPFHTLGDALRNGLIVAIKGIGGVHLACDATNEQAVKRLRERKQRPDKALALMAANIEAIRQFARVNEKDETLLAHSAAPVVLLSTQEKTDQLRAIAPSVAPDNTKIGVMLPYSPVHHLLLAEVDFPLVMTSGNRSGEPQAITNEAARSQLSDIADLLLLHNRPIHNRLDDSVVVAGKQGTQILRRARGYAPTSLPLPPGFPAGQALIALGGQLKNTLCLVKGRRAVITQHLGDLHDASTFDEYLHTLQLYRELYDNSAEHYVCDMHPEYLSTKHGVSLEEQGNHLTRVQHHHAHIAACLGDNEYPLAGEAVLGICLDGTGFGTDETLWGGEFLYGSYAEMRRVASLLPVSLIGGAQAIKSPWRSLYAQLRQCFSAGQLAEMTDICPQFADPMCNSFEKMLTMQLNCPLSSSAGRLFDAVAAALGCAPAQITYEGQAAIRLESLAMTCHEDVKPYHLNIIDNHIVPQAMWQQIVADLRQGRNKAAMAMAFHKGLVIALSEMTLKLKAACDFTTVVLSGGVMQNLLLGEALQDTLQASDFKVLKHQQLPANDGGIAFGQALVALAKNQ